MFARVSIFPKVTTSKKDFIDYISKICGADIENEKDEEWFRKIDRLDGFYFSGGVMLISKLVPCVILHELIHHFSAFMRGFTQSKKWYKLDNTLDELDIFIFRKN